MQDREVTGIADIQDTKMKTVGDKVEKVGLCRWDVTPFKGRVGSVI